MLGDALSEATMLSRDYTDPAGRVALRELEKEDVAGLEFTFR
jgi:hypothetical protein